MLKHLKKRGFVVLLSGVLLFGQVSVYAQTKETSLCEQHTAHTAECGCIEDGTKIPCTFLCETCNSQSGEDVNAPTGQLASIDEQLVPPDTVTDSDTANEAVTAQDMPRATVHHFTTHYGKLLEWMDAEKIQDGDTIILDAEPYITEPGSGPNPVVIDKSVTIQGGSKNVIHFRAAGLVLGANVTFNNIVLGFQQRTRSAIMANGHTLTLNDVTQNQGTRDIHLFCGGLTGHSTTATQGTHGQIIIRGNTTLANIYAGSLSSNGAPNDFNYPATITIDGSATGNMGNIYASGAKQAFVDDGQMINPDYEPAPPTPDPNQYVVTGDVLIHTYRSISRFIDGRTGGSEDAKVIYNGTEYPNETLTLTNIGGLSVQSGGMLTPARGSSMSSDNAEISVAPNTQLSLVKFDKNLTTGDFTGGGTVVLDPNQSWMITGAVNGTTTKIGIGGIWSNASTSIPQKNHTYITAPASNGGSFQLIPSNTNPQQILYRNEQGGWMVGTADQMSVKVNHISVPDDFSLPMNNSGAKIPITVDYASTRKGMASIPVSITVNGISAIPSGGEATGFSYRADSLGEIKFAKMNDGEFLIITGTGTQGAVTPDTYRIDCTIPAAYMANGQDCTIHTVLAVASEQSGSLKVFNGDQETTQFSYGDTITVKFTPTSGQTTNSRKNTPAASKAVLYYGDKPLTTPVSADDNGVFTLTHTTGSSDTIPASDFVKGTQKTLRVSYDGNGSENGSSAEVLITLNPKTVTAFVVNKISKPYDANTDAAVQLGISSEDYVRKGDSLTVKGSGTYNNKNAGTDKPVTLIITETSGINHEAYNVILPTNITGTITKARTNAPNAPELEACTADSITLKAVTLGSSKVEAEYSIDNGKSWQTGRTFTNLSSGTSYTFLARYPETENYLASPISASATFKTDQQYTVTVLTNEYGTASASQASAVAGTPILLTAMPNSGCHFVYWDILSGNITINKNTFVMPADNVTVRAIFAPNPPTPNNGLNSDSLSGKPKFIALLYENTLGRHPAQSEIDYWEQELSNGTTGADTAYGFLFSQEFQNKNYGNSDYGDHLYLSLMGRPSDISGKQGWVKKLDDGMSRTYVFKQFINSQEFANLCSAYGIERGEVTLTEERDRNYDVTRFVARNYTQFLGRDYDADGLNYWAEPINNHTKSMQDIAFGFVFSPECMNKNLSDSEFAAMLYRGCFDREGEQSGIEYWAEKLQSGEMDKIEVFYGFANSQEFANMVKSYGL
ncbi:MAG: DUF4214 domain-containing protein [Roseburia sp.]